MQCKDPFKNCDEWECIKSGCQSSAPSIEISHLTDDDFIIVHEVVENEDGTASVALDLGKNALRMLIEIGFIAVIKEGIRSGGATQNEPDPDHC